MNFGKYLFVKNLFVCPISPSSTHLLVKVDPMSNLNWANWPTRFLNLDFVLAQILQLDKGPIWQSIISC